MTRIVYLHVEATEDALVVLDAERRTYAAVNREGTAYHLIQPARPDDPRVGDGLRSAGELVCTCAGGTFRGFCYRVREAEAFEAGRLPESERTWFDGPEATVPA